MYYILSLQPIILLLNIGIVTILDGLIPFRIESKVYELGLVVVLEFILVYTSNLKIRSKNNAFMSRRDFYSLLLISVSLFVLFSLLVSPVNLYLTSGDGNAHLNVLNDIKMYKQEIFHHVYFDNSQKILQIGNFYPRASHYLGNIITVESASNSLIYYYLMILSFSLFWPTVLYQLIKLYTNSRLSISILLFLLTLNIFPLGLIYTSNLSSIYGVIIAVGGFVLLENLVFSKQVFKFFLILVFSSVIALYHPSAIFTFAFLFICNYFFAAREYSFKLTGYSRFIILIIVLLFLVFTKLSNELDTYFSSMPINYKSLNDLVPLLFNFDVIQPYLVQYYNLSFYSSLIMVPNFFLILCIILLNGYKRFFSFISLFIYLLIITSTFFAGFERPLSWISLLGIMYYQSPIRIAHLGIIVYALIVISYVIYNKNLNLFSLRKYTFFQFFMFIYLLIWTYLSLTKSFQLPLNSLS